MVAESVPWDSVLSSLDAGQDFPGNAAYVYAPFVDPEALDMELFSGRDTDKADDVPSNSFWILLVALISQGYQVVLEQRRD